jgi:uncharacterized protein (TIGR03382 family)
MASARAGSGGASSGSTTGAGGKAGSTSGSGSSAPADAGVATADAGTSTGAGGKVSPAVSGGSSAAKGGNGGGAGTLANQVDPDHRVTSQLESTGGCSTTGSRSGGGALLFMLGLGWLLRRRPNEGQ